MLFVITLGYYVLSGNKISQYQKITIHWILENITPLIGHIYMSTAGISVNTKPTDPWSQYQINLCIFTTALS